MKQYLSLFFYSVGVILFSHDAVAQHAVAAYRMPIEDCGILISPSQPGDPYYESDGGGMREPNIYKVGNTYYLFYDRQGKEELHMRFLNYREYVSFYHFLYYQWYGKDKARLDIFQSLLDNCRAWQFC